MSIRQIRSLLTILVILLATTAAIIFFVKFQNQKNQREIASEITTLCQIPEIPEELNIHHALIERSSQSPTIEILLTLTGKRDSLYAYLEKIDHWEKNRPTHILRHSTKESEQTHRFHFAAEVYPPSKK